MVRFPCLLLAITGCCLASPNEPGPAAVEFLHAVRDGTPDLAPGKGTAISAYTSPYKVQEIAGRLKRMAHDIGERELKVGHVKIDNDLAGVLVWSDQGHDPRLMQVFPVAMIRRDGLWLPAPVPASFENCGIGLDSPTRRRTSTLESWMLRQQVLDLAELSRQSLARMREKITAAISHETITGLSARQTIQRFLDACRHRREYEILGLMGGLHEPLPENWLAIATSIGSAVRAERVSSPWRLLMNEHVIASRIFYQEDPGEVLATIGCLDAVAGPIDPEGLPQVELAHLNAARGPDGGWRIQPPEYFWNPAADGGGVADPELDKDLLETFTTSLLDSHPRAAAETAAVAAQQLSKALGSSTPAGLIPLVLAGSDNDHALLAIRTAAARWRQNHGLTGSDHPRPGQYLLQLDLTVSGNLAAISYQAFSPRRPDRFALETCYLENTANGWLWNPVPGTPTVEPFSGWRKQQQEQWQHQWRDRLLEGCPVVTKAANEPAGEAACKALIESWLTAIRAGDVRAALGHCARLGMDDSPALLLRNLGYEITGAVHHQPPAGFHGYYAEGNSAAVALRSGPAENPSFPFYPVIATDAGPRLLLEVDLIASASRGRTFLNRTSIDRVAKQDPAAGHALRQLFDKHARACMEPQP